MIISTKNIQQAKNQIRTAKRPIILQAQDLEFNRKILEYGKFQILLDIHNTEGKDKLRKLDSGLNHVLAKIAAKNSIAIGIDLNKLRKLPRKKKAIEMARIIRNVEACRRAKCHMALVNQKDKKDTFELLISLGASTSQAKEATTF
ncbi:MAG: hypothetical protein ABH864_04940 [archaeon]